MPLRILACLLTSFALAATWAATLHARQGFYLGLGVAQQSVGGDLDGSHTFIQSGGNAVFFDGKLDAGDPGMELQVGYGLNRIFGLEYQRVTTKHTADSSQLDEKTDATLSAEVYSVRITAPFSENFEGFLRAGYGLYVLEMDDFARSGVPLTKVGDAVFSGKGTALGLGFEIYTGSWRWGLGYSLNSIKFDTARANSGRSLSLKKEIAATAETTSLTLAYHFGTARN